MKRVMPLYKKGVLMVFFLFAFSAFFLCFGLTMFGGISIGVFLCFTSRLVQSVLQCFPTRSFLHCDLSCLFTVTFAKSSPWPSHVCVLLCTALHYSGMLEGTTKQEQKRHRAQ